MPPLIWRGILGVAVTVACHGWAGWLDDLLQGSKPVRTPVARGALGLAVLLALGGVLNIFHLLVSPVYAALLIAGVVGAMRSGIRQWRAGAIDRVWCATAGIGGFLLLPIYFLSIDTTKLNGIDDFHTYLVMPMRILANHTLAFDPFSYGATTSGGGGNAFLQAPIIGLFGIKAVRLVDQGAGLLLLVGTLASLFRQYRLPVFAGVGLLASSILFSEHALVNVSSYFLSLALLVALVQVLCLTGEEGGARPVFAALLLAGIIALKNTTVPFAVLLCGLFVVRSWWQRAPRRLRDTAVAFGLVAAIAGCWWLPRLGSPVTLFPLEHGFGTDQVNLGYMLWWVTTDSPWNWIYWAVFLLAWVLALHLTRRHPDHTSAAWVGWAALGGSLALNYATGGIAITRYTQPLVWVAFLFCATLFLAHMPSRQGRLYATVLLGLCFVAFRLPPPTGAVIPEGGLNRVAGYIAFHGGQPVGNYFRDFATGVQKLIGETPAEFPTPAQRESVRRIQSAMLPGTAALVHTDLPFLFDFRRNQIWGADFAAVSPAPGMPFAAADGSRLADYLRAHSVRYVAYAYGDEAGFPEAVVNQRLLNPRFTPWQRALNRRLQTFHQQLRTLAARFPKVYDDGQTEVIDLGTSTSR